MYYQQAQFGRPPVPPPQKKTIADVFHLFWDKVDLDNSGELTRDELWAAVQVVTAVDHTYGTLLAGYLKNADINNDGSITRKEWQSYTDLVVMMAPQQFVIDSLGAAVEKMDAIMQSGMKDIFDETSEVLGMDNSDEQTNPPPCYRRKWLPRLGVYIFQNEAGERFDSLKQAWAAYRESRMVDICSHAAAAHKVFVESKAAWVAENSEVKTC